LIKYVKSFFWIVAKRLSYIEEARCLKVKYLNSMMMMMMMMIIIIIINSARYQQLLCYDRTVYI